jgi:hydrophobic/amphiphilic exporter-1 (mainly G- bacteria), HAE1 family
VALTLCPMLAAYLVKPREKERAPGPFARGTRRLGGWLAGFYAVTVRACLAFPLLVVLAAGIFSYSAYLTFETLPQELTPTEDRGVAVMRITAPQSASVDYTAAQMRKIEQVLLPYVKSGEATNVYATAGRGSANSGFVAMTLADWDKRERTQQEIVAEVNRQLAGIPGVRAVAIQPNSLGIRGGGQGLQFAIAGQNYDELQDAAAKLKSAMDRDGRWGRVSQAVDAAQPQLSVVVDRQRASDLGVDIDGLAEAMQALLDGRETGRTFLDDKSVPIRIVATGKPINDPNDLANIFLKTGDGRLVPMSSIATVEERPIAPSLNRENRSRAVTLTAQLPEGYAIQQGWDDVQALARSVLPDSMRLVPLAEAATLQETSNGLAVVFGFAIVVIVLVLAAQFESFVSAVIIVATVPLGVACAVYALAFFGVSLNLYSQIGLVLLVGIMAKNGILVVEFANQLREEGMALREAVEKAALIRLRPVMMTMVATVVGGVPLIFASGAGAEARVALGYVIVGGLGLATFSTLYVTPVAYLLLGRFSTPNAEKTAALHRDIAAAERKAAAGEVGHAVPAPMPAE